MESGQNNEQQGGRAAAHLVLKSISCRLTNRVRTGKTVQLESDDHCRRQLPSPPRSRGHFHHIIFPAAFCLCLAKWRPTRNGGTRFEQNKPLTPPRPNTGNLGGTGKT